MYHGVSNTNISLRAVSGSPRALSCSCLQGLMRMLNALNTDLHFLKLRQVPLVLCPHQLGAVTGPTPKLLEAIFLWKFCLAFFVEQTRWKTDIEENEVKTNRISDFSFFKFVPGRCAVQNSNVKMQELDSPPKGVAVHHQDGVVQNAMLAKSFAFSLFWQLLQVIYASQA